ncbi:MAG: hypothetical protein NWF06_03645, partial [Candidatus Bathyarchaeota archaeon]|nr:hypothetical protein [Candidatus Bathyarchaeum sp.]
MMKINSKTVTTIFLVLMLTTTAILLTLPTISAHDPPLTIPTYSYIVVSPNPVGVGQSVYVVMWVHPNPPTAVGEGGDVWRDMTLTVKQPDGNVETFGPWNSDSTGSTFTVYTVNQIGTYEFTMDYPGQVISWYGPNGLPPGNPDYLYGRGMDVYVNDTFTGSSATTTLTVTDEPVEKIPEYPLPTEYWTRPIEGQNTAWANLGSHWLGGSHIGAYKNVWQKDGIAPNSAHIMWTMPAEFGGIVGGLSSNPNDATGFYSGGSYEGRFQNSIIMYGRLYCELPLSHSGSGGGYVCIDLNSGEEIWRRDDIRPTFGQLYNYESRNQHGVVGGILWQTSGSKWIGIDAFTGKNAYNLTGVPSGTEVYTNLGEIERYVLNYADRELSLWSTAATNASNLVRTPGTASEAYQFRPLGKEIDVSGANQYLWKVTIPDLPGTSDARIITVLPGDLIFGTSTTFPNFRQTGTPDPYTLWALNLDESRGEIGELIWIKDYSAPEGYITQRIGIDHQGYNPVDAVNRVFIMAVDEDMQFLGYSLDDGSLLWGPTTEDKNDFMYYGSGGGKGPIVFTAYGNLYQQGYGGEIYCYDTANGNLLWVYNNTNSGMETVWGNYPIFIGAIADGKVYAFNNEHSPNYPLYKDEKVYCIDAFTGDELWTLTAWAGQTGGGGTSTMVLADGFVVYYNYYDNQIYCVGKGPSATTLTVQDDVVAKGDSILIKGIVTDQSPGTEQFEQTKRFANGVPAVADECMSSWMEYV